MLAVQMDQMCVPEGRLLGKKALELGNPAKILEQLPTRHSLQFDVGYSSQLADELRCFWGDSHPRITL